jgi:phosphohistidine phosphatase
MDIYLIRHAEAASLAEAGVFDDSSRPLTENGKNQSQKLAACLKQHNIKPAIVITSPLLRARETADEMLREWGTAAPELRFCDDLAINGKRRRLARFIEDLGAEHVALVGHQPDLGKFAAWLIGSKKAEIDFAKAGVACVHCEQQVGKGEGVLEWLITPDWYSSDAKSNVP